MKESQLQGGLIPKYTSCPYKYECDKNSGMCPHRGHDHEVAFSCALARLFDLIYTMEK